MKYLILTILSSICWLSCTITSNVAHAQVAIKASIPEIQGEGFVSPMEGELVETSGIVTRKSLDSLAGLFIQNVNPDNNPETSEGLFIDVDVIDKNVFGGINIGDLISVQGRVLERHDQTIVQFSELVSTVIPDTLIEPTIIHLPAEIGSLEAYEGMLVAIENTFTISEQYNLTSHGQLLLAVDDSLNKQYGRFYQSTQLFSDQSERDASIEYNKTRILTLDDGFEEVPTGDYRVPSRYQFISGDSFMRVGDQVSNLTGHLDQGVINRSSRNPITDYRLQPLGKVNLKSTNKRISSPPQMSGRLVIGSYNVLNYFNGDGTEAFGTPDRGAENYFEFERQSAKIESAILAMDADILGLIELENDGFGTRSAITDLVRRVNQNAGSDLYDYVSLPVDQVGNQSITVGIIYKPESVKPIGPATALTSDVRRTFNDILNRPPIAQTFEEIQSEAKLTLVVNHLKSKGSPCDDFDDPDRGNGEGNCSQIRLEALAEITDWINEDPTNSSDSDVLLLGDFNAYSSESAFDYPKSKGYSMVLDNVLGKETYSYIFGGRSGVLDHFIASGSMVDQIVDAAVWHINSDESSLQSYYSVDEDQIDYYRVSPFRSSDHDPVLISLDLKRDSLSTDVEDQINADHLVKVYPNPVANGTEITVQAELPINLITIVDVKGNEVQFVDGGAASSMQVDISKLLPGVYYARVKLQNGSLAPMKFVVK